jgi:hypothetical protein
LTSKVLSCSKQIKTIIFPQQNNDNITKIYCSTKIFLDMLTFSISGEKSVPESGSWTAEEAERPPHRHRRDHDCGAATPPGDQRRQRLFHPGGHRLRQPHTGCILQLNTSRMMGQTQQKNVSTTHPPAHPFLKRGAGEGCILVNPKTLPTSTNQKQLPTKAGP